MVSPNWFLTDRTRFSVIDYNEKKYMICFSNTVKREIIFVEEVETGKRVLPLPHEKNMLNEKVIENLIIKIQGS
ncbi:hypothetical protein BB776_03140 [Planococcus salinarum]|uniref:YcxB-like protein domain-containing protein n=1 Tax=Planococcus salinarum TaxID=622695 RepID=A0ABX3D0G1_9BACL|nr:hypothetical protein BB776_03140 [Planococcus salinarum]